MTGRRAKCWLGRDPSQRHHLPEEAGPVERGFEAEMLGSSLDSLRPMHEDLESPSRHPQAAVGERQTTTRPPRPSWKAQYEHLPGVRGSCPSELWHVRLAAQDAVHDHDVGGLHIVARLGEIHHLALHAILESRTA